MMMCLCMSRTFKNSGVRGCDTQEEPLTLSVTSKLLGDLRALGMWSCAVSNIKLKFMEFKGLVLQS